MGIVLLYNPTPLLRDYRFFGVSPICSAYRRFFNFVLTPSPFGHSPYIPLRKHRGRGGLTLLLPLLVFLIPLLVATLLSSPLYFFAPHTAMLRGTAREDCDTKDFLSLSKKVLVTLIRFICSFFLAARKTNQEAPPFLLTPPSLRATSPIFCATKHPVRLRDTAGGEG